MESVFSSLPGVIMFGFWVDMEAEAKEVSGDFAKDLPRRLRFAI
jgi:hypothetical protein